MIPYKHANSLSEALQHIRNGMAVNTQDSIVSDLAKFLYEENANSPWDPDVKSFWDEAEDFIKEIWMKEARDILRLYLVAKHFH